MIKCPFCAENISRQDTKCKFCKEDLIALEEVNKFNKNENNKNLCPICKGENHEKAIICKYCNVRLTPLNPREKVSQGLVQLSNLLYIAGMLLLLFTLYQLFG